VAEVHGLEEIVLVAVNSSAIGGEIRFGRMSKATEDKLASSAKITFTYMRLCGQGGTKIR